MRTHIDDSMFTYSFLESSDEEEISLWAWGGFACEEVGHNTSNGLDVSLKTLVKDAGP